MELLTQSEDLTISGAIIPFIGAILSLLIIANGFFIKRLVDQLDATREIVWQLRQDVVVLKVTVDNLSFKHKQVFQN